MIKIDHVCFGTRNIFKSSRKLCEETGLGFYDGGHFPNFGLANRMVPCGGDVYIEIEGTVDVEEYEKGNRAARFFHENTAQGETFIGWNLRVDTRQELEQVAKRLNTDIFESALRVRPDGAAGVSARAPDTFRCWKAGLPNFFYIADMANHPSRLPAHYGRVAPTGVPWMEVGGTKEEFADYMGQDPSSIGLRFNGKAAGLYAMGISTKEGQQIEIRRPPLPGTTGKLTEDAFISSVEASYK